MHLNVKVKLILLVSFIITAHGLVYESKWINRLVKYIKEDLRIYQAVFVIDESFDKQTIKIESILQKVQSNIPSKIISLQNATLFRAGILKKEQASQDIQSTTLFIAILLLQNNQESLSFPKTTQLLTGLSAHQVRPKCLMIVFPPKEGLVFKEQLQKMWSKNFLHVTIIEVIERHMENSFSVWNCSRSIKVHHFSPFTNIYARKNYGETIKFFPNTLQNLNGFQMKVASFNYPPYVNVKRNSTGHPISVSGPEALVVKALSKAMNFKVAEIPLQKESWGRWNCDNASISTGIARKLRDNEIRFTTNQGVLSYNCSLQSSRCTGRIRYKVLILKSKESKRSLLLSMKWLYLVLMIVPIWLITRVLKFDTYYWSLIDIIQAMLGFTVPREPQRSTERIVFATVLIAFSVFSSTIFAIITDIQITEEPYMVIDTLEDLIKSNLIPAMPEIIYNVLTKQSDSIRDILLNKTRTDISHEECLKMILSHKKVAWIDRELRSEMFLQGHVDEDGRPVMQLVKQTFGHYQMGMIFQKNSPFVRAADKILIKILESGLDNHWRKPLLSRLIKLEEPLTNEEKESANLIIPLIIILATGYGLSIVVFIIELLMKYTRTLAFECISFIRSPSSL